MSTFLQVLNVGFAGRPPARPDRNGHSFHRGQLMPNVNLGRFGGQSSPRLRAISGIPGAAAGYSRMSRAIKQGPPRGVAPEPTARCRPITFSSRQLWRKRKGEAQNFLQLPWHSARAGLPAWGDGCSRCWLGGAGRKPFLRPVAEYLALGSPDTARGRKRAVQTTDFGAQRARVQTSRESWPRDDT